MGISAKPFGKFGGKMRKIRNQRNAELYTAKHMMDKKKKESEKKENPET